MNHRAWSHGWRVAWLTLEGSVALLFLVAGLVPSPAHAQNPVVVSALVADDVTGNNQNEWVEFQNRMSAPFNLNQCVVRIMTDICTKKRYVGLSTTGSCASATPVPDECLTCLNGNCTVPGNGGYFLVASGAWSGSTTPNAVYGPADQIQNDGAIILECPNGQILDVVGYDGDGAVGTGCAETAPIATDIGDSDFLFRIGRTSCAQDTQNNALDFGLTQTPIVPKNNQVTPAGGCTSVPITSTWEVAILALLLLTAGSLSILRGTRARRTW
jgi:hypothetical protein